MKNKLHEFLRFLKTTNKTKRDLTHELKAMKIDIEQAPKDIMHKHK
jgi:hypothetical protein